MTLEEFRDEFAALGEGYKTADVDRWNKSLMKRKEDVSFLKEIILTKEEYHRTYFQVTLASKEDLEEKLTFIENNFDKLRAWWHVDQLPQFLKNDLQFSYVYQRAKNYINNNMTFVRRWGYVIFIPYLVKEPVHYSLLFELFRNDKEYYVQMAEAWLLAEMAVYDPESVLKYLKQCDLNYDIVGKAIGKICDSYRINERYKIRAKEIRKSFQMKKRKNIH